MPFTYHYCTRVTLVSKSLNMYMVISACSLIMYVLLVSADYTMNIKFSTSLHIIPNISFPCMFRFSILTLRHSMTKNMFHFYIPKKVQGFYFHGLKLHVQMCLLCFYMFINKYWISVLNCLNNTYLMSQQKIYYEIWNCLPKVYPL